MATTLMTPGVYIEEKNAFPNSAVAVETAVPVFIGYTSVAVRNGKSLLRQPVRITSFAEYIELFGAGFKPKYTIADAAATDKDAFVIDGKSKVLAIADNNTFYLYNSIRLFYANGGGPAYIVSVGTYGDKPEGFEINAADFIGSADIPSAIDLLINEQEPTLVVIPDAIALGEECYNSIYTTVLLHCAKMQSRFGIFDLVKQPATATTDEIVAAFRDKIGINALNYGAAYYPWIQATVVQPDEINFENFDAGVDLGALLPEDAAKEVVTRFKAIAEPNDNDKRNFHLSLKATSITYVHLLNELRNKENELPPSGAMAGIYTLVDNSRGVWKAPANVSLSMVNAPTVNISHDAQQQLNIDVMAGKSINVIRPFPGVGTLVWGGRTLDGNSQDWRYINVRRTMIMLEQSIKLACRAYVFEPNDANTWVTVKSMIVNFLTNLWKQGALAGAVPEQAFDVQIGLGSTMTPTDILDGKMLVMVKVAIVRPAEFIVITFQQQMQQS
ncbi:phage tail sheath subtilisin-like domain-containing protein [Mucilaginibacter sp. RS28]|uniref:Phage tail sheath subtilisin-like domain-containing protein n=1 Tax=Mucilaginibacter straminoryzae TaxID=2932774 RepID=A0A9X2B7H3_9SPHI|nr:phage tail sheath C-terminal domain-containing protein [Mucilaginibacter straminoryzae]MCJ8208321.1 phage tail sheath subtilisin-like domain-containing protein [Mucilaginibacter straminoryzae]